MPFYTHDHAMRLTPGTPWRPANGVEGELFNAQVCRACRHGEDGECDIAMCAMAYQIDDQGYPPEWVINRYGQPSCTAFSAPEGEYRCNRTPDMFGGS